MNLGPDWVMLGMQSGTGGVVLFASSKLTYGELEIKRDYWEIQLLENQYISLPPPEITMRAEMTDVTMVEAATYGEAFAKLAGQWQPPEPGMEAITSGEVQYGQRGAPRIPPGLPRPGGRHRPGRGGV